MLSRGRGGVSESAQGSGSESARRAAVRWTAARRGSCVLAPPLDSRRPSVASRLCRRSGQRRGGAAVRWRRLSTRGARPSPLVSVAVWTAARRAAVRWTAAQLGSCALAPPLDSRRPSVASRLVAAWTAARRGSCALDSGAARQQCAGAAFDSRPPSVASRLIAVWTAARRAAVRWTAARRASCVLAPPLDSRRPSVASRLCRRLDSGAARQAVRWRRLSTRDTRPSPLVSRRYSGAASSCALDSGAARQQCAGAASRLEASVRRLSSQSPSGQRRGEAAD